jgi:hypothetical protein
LTLGKGYYSRAGCLGHCDLCHLCTAKKQGLKLVTFCWSETYEFHARPGIQTGANWRKPFQPGANRRKSVQTIAKQAQFLWPPTADKHDSPLPSPIMYMSITSPGPQRSLGSERLSAFRATSYIIGIATRDFSRKVVFAQLPPAQMTPAATYLTAGPELRPRPEISAKR